MQFKCTDVSKLISFMSFKQNLFELYMHITRNSLIKGENEKYILCTKNYLLNKITVEKSVLIIMKHIFICKNEFS